MPKDSTITFPRNAFFFCVLAAVVVLIALGIILCRKPGEDRSKLAEALESKDVVVVPVIEEGGTVTLLGPEGDVIEACGKSGENGTIIGVDGRECGFKDIELTGAQEILILRKVGSPPCMAINVGGSWFDVHETNDTQTPKRWRRGQYPCNVAGPHSFLR
jgi:hypothetical protein